MFATDLRVQAERFGRPAGLARQPVKHIVQLAGTDDRTLEMITKRLLILLPFVVCSSKTTA